MHDTPFRSYDPQLGRFHQIDLMADIYANQTPYNFANNDPIYWSDPTGLCPMCEQDPDKADALYKKGVVSSNRYGEWVYLGRGKWKTVWEAEGLRESVDSWLNEFNLDSGLGFQFSSISIGDDLGTQSSGAGWLDSTIDWIGDHSRQLAITTAAGLNAYAGYQQIKVGVVMFAAPTGITQFAGAYSIVDGATRLLSAPIQIFGTWTGNTTLENAPSNLLGTIGFLIDSGSAGQWTTGGNAQAWLGIAGDFGLSRMKLVQILTNGFDNPNGLKRMGQMVDAGWQIVRPYVNSYRQGLKR